MIRLLFIFQFCVLTLSVSAQGVWTWIKGDSISFNLLDPSVGSRGQLRIPALSNNPSTYLHSLLSAMEWKDKNDNLWLLYEYGDQNQFGLVDTIEIWRYHIPSNTWTWMAGYDSFEISGSYSNSIKSSYKTSLRTFQSLGSGDGLQDNLHWADSASNFWIMTRVINTGEIFLSKFNIQTYQFEIIDYRQNNYRSKGTKYIPNTSNFPGFTQSPTYWVNGHNVYFFGGINQDTGSTELWRYNMNTNIWTWMGGDFVIFGSSSDKSVGKGITSAINWPGYRYQSTNNWVRNNKLYFFGGATEINYGSSKVWEYDLNTNYWTWLHGGNQDNSIYGDSGIYPISRCIESSEIYPSGRAIIGSILPNTCDRVFWIFGGYEGNTYKSDDLWMYRPDDNQWVWVDGQRTVNPNSNVYYNFGIKGVPSINNSPPTNPNFVFSSSNGSIYRFGCYYSTGIHFNNMIWRYDPDYSCVNYNITDKFIDRGIDKYICLGDSTAVRVRKGYDSLRVSPMTAVTLRQTDTTTEVWLKPSADLSYKITAYGYRCESYLDSLTVPIVVAPPAIGYDTVSICEGKSLYGKTTTGNYTIKIKNPLGCDSTLYLKLTVLTLPRTTLDTTVCEGNSVQGHTNSGTYRDTFPAANGCDSIYTLKLTVIPKYLNIDTALCRGSSIAGYSSTGTYYDTLTSSQGCITYRVIKLTMNEPSSSTVSQTICQGQNYGGHTTSGIYKDTLRNAKGCDSIRTLTLTVLSTSRMTINQNICAGTSYLGRTKTGTYFDTFKNSAGCDSIQTLNLTVRQPIVLSKLRDTLLCYRYSTRLDAGFGHRAYLWNTGEITSSIEVNKSGWYRLTYEDNTGCKGSDSAKVEYKPQTTIAMVDTLSNYKGESFSLNPKILPSANGRYRWTPANIFSCDTCKSVQFKPEQTVLVTLEYTDDIGCKTAKSVVVNIYDSWAVGFPTAFSPNGDGLNDFYFPNVANIHTCTYAIYNRWGEKIFSSNLPQSKWNGSYKGQPAPVGVYAYYAEIILINGSRKIYSGEFQIVR